MGSDEIHHKMLVSSNESFINRLFEKCIEHEMISYISKIAIVIPLHKNSSIHLKSNHRPVSQTCIVC